LYEEGGAVLLFNARLIGLSIAGLAVSGVALAQEANVSTGATSAKLGGEFRSELTYTDNGLMKMKGGDDPDSSTWIGVSAANVTLDGKINADTEYAFRFNLLNPRPTADDPGKGPLDYGWGKHWFNKMMGFSIGRQKILQGGWDNIEGGYRKHAVGVYASNLVFNEYEDVIGVHLNVAGSVTLQLANDRMVDADDKMGRVGNAAWNTTKHPTWILGWAGNFGPIAPMFNIGSYDNNKSRWIDLGVKTDMNGLNASLDIYQNTFTMKVADGKDNKEPQNVATAVTLNVGYTIKGTATPWLYFSTYDNKQADDSKLGLKDSKVNSAGEWDDNGQVWGVGADLHMMGKGWSPFVAIIGRSGKWDDGAGKEETKSDMTVKIGALGEI
jgi:hypothetical protein